MVEEITEKVNTKKRFVFKPPIERGDGFQEMFIEVFAYNNKTFAQFLINGKNLQQLSEILQVELLRPIHEVYGCFRLIPKGKLKKRSGESEIPRLFWQSSGNDDYAHSIHKHMQITDDWIASLPAEKEFSTFDFKRATNLHTFGDVSKAYLDFLVCNGILDKTKFSCGRKGNRYRKRAEQSKCKFLELNEDREYYCSFDGWKIIGNVD